MIDRVFAGRYRITEKVGIGGMAEVYKATDETLGRTVAVKVMLPQYSTDETFVVRFKQEAQAAANLQSPYIVNIYDWGYEQSDRAYFIVMEYIRGTDLKTAITQRGAINQRKVAEIGAQVAAALGVAHSYDIIHRDIKPQNIMVQPDGNAKVMDFGIARSNNANLTQTGSVLGTAYYVSPEQAQGKPLTAATDIYSLGVVLYEAVTGQVPFDGPDAVSIAVKQVNEQPVPPRAIDSNIDPKLEAIIMKAMQKNPADRFSTADEMRLVLTEYLQGKPLTGVDPDARTRVISTPAVIPPAQATAVMPELATDATHMRAGGANNGTNGGKKKNNTPLIVALVCVFVALIAGIAIYFAFCANQATGDISVPKVVGLTEEEAVIELTAAGLTLGDVTSQSSETIEAGKIISQDPAAQAKVAEGTKVNIVLSTGTGNADVPELRGKSPDEAKAILDGLGLKYKEGAKESSSEVAEGMISSQSPAAGTKAKKGDEVTCNISSGVETVQVPNVYGQSKADAEKSLANAGLNVVYAESQHSSAVPEGCVISQDKTGPAKRGDTVTLTLSLGPAPTPVEQVAVPSIVGLGADAASNALVAQGLSLANPEDGADGKIVKSQTPEVGTMVDKGTKITAVFE